MEFKYVNPKEKTLEELLFIMEYNCSVSSEYRKHIENYKKANKLSETINNKDDLEYKNINNIESKIDDIEESNSNFEEEVLYYFSQLMEIDDNANLKNSFYKLLPSKENYNYNKIIKRLIAEFYKKIIEIKKFIDEEIEEMDEIDLQEFKNEVNTYNKKINIINEISNEKGNVDNREEINNKLVFAPTSSGNIRVLGEIENISPEVYPIFKELLDSIKNGTFKNVKYFSSSNTIVGGISEVRYHQGRILFDRIDDDTYVIISMFIKKCYSNSTYKTSLNNSVTCYKKYKDFIVSNIKDEKYMEQHSNYEKELYEKLGYTKSDDKNKVFCKGEKHD